MIKFPSLGLIAEALIFVARRFPGACLAALIGITAVWVLANYAILPQSAAPVWTRLWMLGQLGLPWLFALRVWGESRGWDARWLWAAQALGLVPLGVYYFFISDVESGHFDRVEIPRYFSLLFSAHLLAAVAPYLSRASVADFWEYNRRLFAHFVVGGLYAMVIFLGLTFAIVAIDQLFDINFYSRVYLRLAALVFGGFLTVYFLWHAPRRFDFGEEDAQLDVVLRNLCKYILIPIVAVYFLILYAYAARILVNWELPRGWVSGLSLGFSVAGIFTWLLNYNLPQQDGSPIVRIYRRWFWLAAAPIVVLLFVAIGRRISDYGVTEARFLTAHTGLWIALSCLYFFFSKKDDIRFIPISLIVFALGFSFGPFNAFEVSNRSQLAQLKRELILRDRFEGGFAKRGESRLSYEEASGLNSGLAYFENKGARHRVYALFPFDEAARKKYDNAGALAEWLNISSYLSNTDPSMKQAFVMPHFEDSWTAVPLREKYDWFVKIDFSESAKDGMGVRMAQDGRMLECVRYTAGKSEVIDRFPLAGALRYWWDLPAEYNTRYLRGENRQTQLRGQTHDLLLMVEQADLRQKDSLIHVKSLQGLCFLKKR